MKYLLGIDIGTTSMKGMLINELGEKICSASENYSLEIQGKHEVEIDAESYWEAFKRLLSDIICISKINSKDIMSVAIDSQGETLICVDENGETLRKAIVWLDNRSTREAEEIKNKFGMKEIFNRTGQPEVVATWPATKILWLKKNEKHIFEKTKKYLLVEDYINYKLTGKYVTDKSLASSTLYFCIRNGIWWKEALDCAGITDEQLPCIEASGMKIGGLTDEAVKETGLGKDTMVVTGAMDQMAGAIGAGNITSDIVSESTGTCLAMCVNIQNPIQYNPKYRIPCHCNALSSSSAPLEQNSLNIEQNIFNTEKNGLNIEENRLYNRLNYYNIRSNEHCKSVCCNEQYEYNRYSLLFWSQTAGVILEWNKDNFYKNCSELHYNGNNSSSSGKYSKNSGSILFQQIDNEAAKLNPGSDGLILLPHFSGSAVPHFNPGARGVFFGITLKHTRAHFSRAIMESVGNMLREHIETAESFGIKIKEVRSLGGGARSSLWNQIKADITGKEIVTLENTETASLGAAMLAGIGAGIFKSFQDACMKCVKVKDRYYPNTKNTAVYEEVYGKYKELYNSVKHLF